MNVDVVEVGGGGGGGWGAESEGSAAEQMNKFRTFSFWFRSHRPSGKWAEVKYILITFSYFCKPVSATSATGLGALT